MRVLVSCPLMGMGGAERVAAQIVTALAGRGHEVGLVAAAGCMDADLVGVSHSRFFLPPPARSAAGVGRLLAAMRSAVAEYQPDVIHAQNVLHAALARVAGRTTARRRPRVLATFHGLTPGEYRIAARLFRAADAVACVSDELLDILLKAGYPPRRTRLVRNAIDIPALLTRERVAALDAEFRLCDADGRHSPVVAVVGRLVPQKAYDRFLHAAAWVAERQPEVRFLVVGDGELRPDLQALARDLGIADKVRFTLFRTDARDIIARADLLVFTSKWEGLSLAALEAVACGTPVVSTETPGMRSLLSSGAGEIVSEDPESIGRAIGRLLRDDSRRITMGEVGRRLAAEEFSLEAMIDTYIGLYGELIRSRTVPTWSGEPPRVLRTASAHGRRTSGAPLRRQGSR